MAFCPSVFKLSLWHFVCFPWWVPSLVRSISVTLRQFYFLQCAFFDWVDFADPKAPVFRFVLFWWSRFCWPRGTNLIFAVRSLRWGRFRWPWGTNLISVLILVKPILLTSRYQFISCSALSSVESILLTLRHDFDPFGCPHLGEADLVDFEVQIYFLQWIALWHLDSGLVGSSCCR